ncbi:MAG: hypothetical protein ACR2P1_27455, partial [Pseudomonadales bacterium]
SLRHPEWHAQLTNGKSGLREVFLGLSPILGHSVLEPYLDAYRVVAEQLANQDAAQPFEQKAFVASCLVTGKQLLLQRQLVSSESIAKAMFETGVKVARDYGLLDSSSDPKLCNEKRQQFAIQMSKVGRQVRALRSLSSARRSGLFF